jgi:NAD(P)-dependent dehydrogenase (short-subunit alcohol dehydrogenase family)
MDVAVTGAAGFIGTRLSNYLHQRGKHVIAIVRSTEQARRFHGTGIDVHVCDLARPSPLDPLFKKCWSGGSSGGDIQPARKVVGRLLQRQCRGHEACHGSGRA